MGRVEVHELLVILDFNNERKRMSVILKYKNQITLYCKGSDNVIYERLKHIDKLAETTREHLFVSKLKSRIKIVAKKVGLLYNSLQL